MKANITGCPRKHNPMNYVDHVPIKHIEEVKNAENVHTIRS